MTEFAQTAWLQLLVCPTQTRHVNRIPHILAGSSHLCSTASVILSLASNRWSCSEGRQRERSPRKPGICRGGRGSEQLCLTRLWTPWPGRPTASLPTPLGAVENTTQKKPSRRNWKARNLVDRCQGSDVWIITCRLLEETLQPCFRQCWRHSIIMSYHDPKQYRETQLLLWVPRWKSNACTLKQDKISTRFCSRN